MTEELALSIAPDSFKRYKDLAGLDEKQTRLFFGWVASLLGRGGTKKTSKCFGVGINTLNFPRKLHSTLKITSREMS